MSTPSRARNDGLVLFFALTFLISWLLGWIPAALTGKSSLEFPTVLLYMLGGFGPSIAGTVLIYRCGSKDERRDFWRSLVDFQRIRPLWIAIGFLLFPVVFLLAAWINAALGGEAPGMAGWTQTLQQPASLIGTVLAGLLFGPLAEELGWRGFALSRMVRRWGLPASALALGLIWWVWHLPLFAIRGTTHYGWGWFTPYFWLFLATVLPLSALLAWGYLLNRRSILLAVILHFMFNTSLSMFFPVSVTMMAVIAVLLYAAAIVVILATREAAAAVQREPAG